MTRYCTLAQARDQLKASTGNTDEDSKLFANILTVSRRIDGLLNPPRVKRPFFAPYIESRKVQIRDYVVNSNNQTFDLDMWILEITTILAGAQDVTTKIVGYMDVPYDTLQLNTTSNTWYDLETSPTITRAYPNPLTITGKWGWSEDWDNGFIATTTLGANVGDTTTTDVTLVDASTFSPGHFIEINDEYMEVIAVNTVTNVITVKRGQNGSTATLHTNGDTVSIWQIPEDIQQITARQAALLYARRGAFSTQETTEIGIVQYPQDLLLDLRNTVFYAYGVN